MPVSSSTRRVPLLAVVTILAAGLACSDATPEPASERAERARKPSKPKIEGLIASPKRVGPIVSSVAPTVEGLDAVLPGKYTVRAAPEGATPGVTVQVLLGEEVILEVFPSDDGQHIARAWSAHRHVVFPWRTRVEDPIGRHENWDRMTCSLAPAPFTGKAICNAFPEARITYLIEGWDGEDGKLPGKELLADLPIAGLVWTPDAPASDQVQASAD